MATGVVVAAGVVEPGRVGSGALGRVVVALTQGPLQGSEAYTPSLYLARIRTRYSAPARRSTTVKERRSPSG